MKLSTQARLRDAFANLLMLVELCGGIPNRRNAT